MNRPTDMELMLFADGELDAERAAAVAAWVEHHDEARSKITAMHMLSGIVRHEAEAKSAGAIDLVDAIMAEVAKEPAKPPKRSAELRWPAARRTSLPRSRGVRAFSAFGAAVLAAAAALLLWTRHEVPAPHARAVASGSASPAASADGAHEHGVEVWSVDFGSQSGAVFYVPSEGSESGTTTVVWVSEDENGGEEDE
jgi:anti-sigma factor RsiW